MSGLKMSKIREEAAAGSRSADAWRNFLALSPNLSAAAGLLANEQFLTVCFGIQGLQMTILLNHAGNFSQILLDLSWKTAAVCFCLNILEVFLECMKM